MANNSKPLVCGLNGNQDLTGLGVRSAFYIQTISFAIAGEFLEAEAGYLHSSTVGLLLAVFIALLRETIRGSLLAPEVSVILWLFVLQLFASLRTVVKTVPDGEKKVTAAAFLTFRLHLLLVFAYIGYATWFWFVGLDMLPHTGCKEWAFFFARVNVRGWYRTLNKVTFGMLCSVGGLYVLFVLGTLAFVFIKKIIRHLKGTPQKRKTVAPIPSQSDQQFSELAAYLFEGQSSMPNKVVLTSTFMLWAALRACLFTGIMVISVELQIQWNQIRNVQSLGSVSQLVPFIIALGQLTHIAYSTIRGENQMNFTNRIRDPADHRLWKEARATVTPSPCPDRGGYHMDEEQHEMIVTDGGT
ncbi:hypothetical protein ACHAPU_010872 [Fusarium lateritium]